MSNNQSSPSRKLNTVNNKQNTVNDMAIVIPSFAMKFRHGQNYGGVPLTMRQELVDAGVTNTMDAIRKGMRTNTTRWNSSDINQINQLNAGDVVRFADDHGALLARAVPNRNGQVGYSINPQQLTDKYGNAWVDRMSQLEGWDVPTMQRLFDKHGLGSAFQYEYLGEDSPIVLAKAQVQTPQQQTQQTGINLSTGQRNAPMPHNPKPSAIQFDSPQTETNMRVFNNRDLFPDRQPTQAGSQLVGSSTVQPTVDLMVGQVGQGEPAPVNPVYGTGTPTFFKVAPDSDRLNKLDEFLTVASATSKEIPQSGINIASPELLNKAIGSRESALGRGGYANFPGADIEVMKHAARTAQDANPDYSLKLSLRSGVPSVQWNKVSSEPKQPFTPYAKAEPNYPEVQLMYSTNEQGKGRYVPMTETGQPVSAFAKVNDSPALVPLNQTLADVESLMQHGDIKELMLRQGQPISAGEIMSQPVFKVSDAGGTYGDDSTDIWRTTGQRESLSSEINRVIDATTPNYQNKSTTRPLYEIQQELAQSMPDSDLLSSAPQRATQLTLTPPSKDVTDRVLNFDERDIVVPPANQVKRESLNEFLGIAPKEGTYNVVSITPTTTTAVNKKGETFNRPETDVYPALQEHWGVNTNHGKFPLDRSATLNRRIDDGKYREYDRQSLVAMGHPDAMDIQDLRQKELQSATRADQQWKASSLRDASGNIARDVQGFPVSASRGVSNLDLAKQEATAQGLQSNVELIDRATQELYENHAPNYPTQQVMGSINLGDNPKDSQIGNVYANLQNMGMQINKRGNVINFSGNPDLRTQMELNQFLREGSDREYLHLPPGYSIAPEYPKQMNEMAERLGRPAVVRNEIVQGSQRGLSPEGKDIMLDPGTGTGVKWQGQPIIVDPTVDVPTIQAGEDAVIIPKGFDPEFQGLRKQWDAERADMYARKLGYENTVHKAVVEGAMGVPSLRDRAKILLEERAQQPMTQPQKPISQQPAPQPQSPFGDNEQVVQQVFGTTDIRGALNNLLQFEYGVTTGDKVSGRSRKATPIYHQDQAQQTFDQYGKPIPKRYLAV